MASYIDLDHSSGGALSSPEPLSCELDTSSKSLRLSGRKTADGQGEIVTDPKQELLAGEVDLEAFLSVTMTTLLRQEALPS
jgi:hypothetical protein